MGLGRYGYDMAADGGPAPTTLFRKDKQRLAALSVDSTAKCIPATAGKEKERESALASANIFYPLS